MSRAIHVVRVAFGLALCCSCATKSLPPGTPPPEYEKRSFEPWPPADAGIDAAEPDAASAAGETALPDAAAPEPAAEPPPPL